MAGHPVFQASSFNLLYSVTADRLTAAAPRPRPVAACNRQIGLCGAAVLPPSFHERAFPLGHYCYSIGARKRRNVLLRRRRTRTGNEIAFRPLWTAAAPCTLVQCMSEKQTLLYNKCLILIEMYSDRQNIRPSPRPNSMPFLCLGVNLASMHCTPTYMYMLGYRFSPLIYCFHHCS